MRRCIKRAAGLRVGLGLATVLLSPAAFAQSSQPIYADSLLNGWQNWSWSGTNFASTAYVHTGADSVQVTYTAGWQGFYLDHAAFNGAQYSTLTFWINGGAANGRTFNIAPVINGNTGTGVSLNNFIAGGGVAASTWRAVTVPLSALGVANTPNLTGFIIQESSGNAQPAFYLDDITLNAVSSTNPAVTIQVDANLNRHAINPNIYGVAYGDAAGLSGLNAPLNRLGGNNTSRYNWLLNADNKAQDYYFESIGDASATAGERGDTFIANSHSGGAQPLITIPMIGWVAKLGPGRNKLASFSISKYGAQTGNDSQWFPDAGNGILSATGQPVAGNDPNDANVPADSNFQQSWVQHLVGAWGTASKGGLRYYILDNEPSIWQSTHRDVHPIGATMDEIKSKTIDYAAKIKAVDPSALVVGPEEWGWSGYLYSGYDQQYGSQHGYSYLPDRANHGGADYLPWLLQQLKANDAATGKRSLDVFSVHYYPQGGEFSNDTSTNMQMTRNRSTRSLWDPNYVDASWINTQVQLIPRLKGWVAQYYPGLQTAVTEYNWGAESSINGATTQADIFGIFGREGLDLATRWTMPASNTPTYKAMALYRNYDGSKSGFGDTSVLDTVPNPDNVSSFAALRSSDGALTVMVINKTLTGTTPLTLNLAHFAGSKAQVWQLTSTNAITRLSDVNVTSSAIAASLPAQSITLYVVK